MLQLIKRCPEYAEGYKAYCQEAYDHHVVFFRPSNPKYLVDDWFERTKEWYDQKEKGLLHDALGKPWVGRVLGVVLEVKKAAKALAVQADAKALGKFRFQKGLAAFKGQKSFSVCFFYMNWHWESTIWLWSPSSSWLLSLRDSTKSLRL